MPHSLSLPKYSIGVGDRFAHEAKAQLRACVLAAGAGVSVIPVWNKSNREHTIIGSEPQSARDAADAAVRELAWTREYYIDADHINLKTVQRFLSPCDFFTIDVADLIGQPAEEGALRRFVARHPELVGSVRVPGIARFFESDREDVSRIARHYLAAVQEAGRIYRYIEDQKGKGNFIPEVSMDETNDPQTPLELLVILAAIADEGIPIQTIAPKFTGRFNKGVDYEGDLDQFTREFSADLAVVAFAIAEYGLPKNLKLSVHSGSDKFAIYRPMRAALQQFDAGVHLKTAGTTWLEELIGLAEAGGDGLAASKEIYTEAYAHRDELCAPYSSVIAIDPAKLPQPAEVAKWSSQQFTAALRHDPNNPEYNSDLRQLLHIGFKVAAKMGRRYLNLLSEAEDTIAKNVTENLFERHIKPLFIGA
jgi:tagaturonate epimerase